MPEKFWILESPRKRAARWDKGNIWRRSDYQDCSNSTSGGPHLTFGGPANRISDLRVILQSEDILDFIWTITDCLIHDRVLEMLRNEGFTGFEAKSARVRWDAGPELAGDDDWGPAELTREDGTPMYWEMLVTGWGGVAAEESGVLRIPNANVWEGFPDWSRILDWSKWDGSDFFIIWPFGFTRLVTDRVATFIRKHNLTGVKVIAPEDYTRLHMQCKPGRITPMRLRDHFPDERAKAIGEPLGIY